jgi:sulfotransferase family protein
MIIGAQKAGTTSLKNYLNEHPDVLGHPQLEFPYFSDESEFNSNYNDIFKKYFTVGNQSKYKAVVAKNAGLYTDEKGIKRLFNHNPNCQLVFVIREPVERAYSAYSMETFNGWLNREFSDIKDVINKKNYYDTMYRLCIQFGMYSEHLKIIYKYFKKSQVKLVLFNDLKNNPSKICKEIFNLIDINDEYIPNLEKKYNVSREQNSVYFSKVLLSLRNNNNPLKKIAKIILPYKYFTSFGNFLIESNKSSKKIEPISHEMRQYLTDLYAPYNKEFEKMTGINLHHWKNNN